MAGLNYQIPSRASAVTPSDTTRLPPASGFYVGGTGDVTVETEGGDIVKFEDLPVGTIIPLRIVRVLATGTDATLIIAFGSGTDVGTASAPFLVLSDGLTFVTEVDGDFVTVPQNG